jgi:hypothetical protein
MEDQGRDRHSIESGVGVYLALVGRRSELYLFE